MNDGLIEDPPGKHAIAEKRREMPRAGDDPVGIIGWHFGGVGVWRGGGGGLFHIHQAVALVLAATDGDQHGEAQAAEGTAPFSPIGGVHDADLELVRAGAERGCEFAHGVFRKQAIDRGTFLGRQRPEALAKGNARFGPFDPFVGEVLPGPPGGLAQGHLDGFRHVVRGSAIEARASGAKAAS